VLHELGIVQGGNKPGEFKNPRGITIDKQYIYICDSGNNRIQVLRKLKENYEFQTQWNKSGKQFGQFWGPLSIYYCFVDNIFYIGDRISVQLFNSNGICEQRLGGQESGKNMDQFSLVRGMCVMNDQLYVADSANDRIQIFKQKEFK